MKIALVGSAPSSVQLAPYIDAKFQEWLGAKPAPNYPKQATDYQQHEWQIWGCSPGAWAVVPRSDRWFEVHRWEPGQPWFSPEYVQFLQQYLGPVYTGRAVPEIPNHVPYPIERVEAEFSAYFLHSSLSLMMAMAILEIEDARKTPGHDNAEDMIGMWGVDMAATEEYGDQRAGCQFFILEALRRGIKVYVPPESCLLRPKPVYGISEWDHNYIKSTQRSKELNARMAQQNQLLQDAQKQLAFLAGAADNMNYYINTWTSPYGLPAGAVLDIIPGTGLGGGFTQPPSHVQVGTGFIPVDVAGPPVQPAPPPPPKPVSKPPKKKAKAKK